MKAKHLYKILPAVIATYSMTCGTSMAQTVGSKRAPKPVTEYSSLEYPGPAYNPQREGYVLPNDHGFVFLKEGNVVPGEVSAHGAVTNAAKGEIELATSKQRMMYTLPTGIQLPVKPGEEMSIYFTRTGEDRGSNFTLVTTTGKKLLHASARSSADAPIRIAVAEGLEVYQQPGMSGDRVPVMVSYKGTTTDISSKNIVAVNIDGQLYHAIVVVSRNVQPTNVDANAYRLEFVIVRQ